MNGLMKYPVAESTGRATESIDSIIASNRAEEARSIGTIGPNPEYDEEGNIIPVTGYPPDVAFTPLVTAQGLLKYFARLSKMGFARGKMPKLITAAKNVLSPTPISRREFFTKSKTITNEMTAQADMLSVRANMEKNMAHGRLWLQANKTDVSKWDKAMEASDKAFDKIVRNKTAKHIKYLRNNPTKLKKEAESLATSHAYEGAMSEGRLSPSVRDIKESFDNIKSWPKRDLVKALADEKIVEGWSKMDIANKVRTGLLNKAWERVGLDFGKGKGFWSHPFGRKVRNYREMATEGYLTSSDAIRLTPGKKLGTTTLDDWFDAREKLEKASGIPHTQLSQYGPKWHKNKFTLGEKEWVSRFGELPGVELPGVSSEVQIVKDRWSKIFKPIKKGLAGLLDEYRKGLHGIDSGKKKTIVEVSDYIPKKLAEIRANTPPNPNLSKVILRNDPAKKRRR